MTWAEFQRARLLMAEERVGTHVRAQDQSDLDDEQRSQDILRQQGLVS